MNHCLICLALVAATAGCRQAETYDHDEAPSADEIAALEAQANAGQAIEPGEPGGLPDERNLVSEYPIDPKSAQGAGQVLQSYAALHEQRRFAEARRLWSDGGRSSELSEEVFAGAYGKYAELHAEIGAPGPMEGAAGSAYVDIPLRFYGRLRDGRPVNSVGTATLRRVNDVPGSTEEQRQWRIYRMEMQPPPWPFVGESQQRRTAMAGFEAIREHMEVIGADGVHIGTVDRIDGDRIKLTRKDDRGEHGGHHHFISRGLVADVEGDQVRLSANADVAVTFEEEESSG